MDPEEVAVKLSVASQQPPEAKEEQSSRNRAAYCSKERAHMELSVGKAMPEKSLGFDLGTRV